MVRGLIKSVTLLVTLFLLDSSQLALAQNTPTVPDAAPQNSSSQNESDNSSPDIEQFQKWLTSNGQKPLSNVPTPPATSAQTNKKQDTSQKSQPDKQSNARDTTANNESESTVAAGQSSKIKKPDNINIQTGPDAPLVQSPPLSYEQSQQIMLKSAPAPIVAPPEDSEQVFNSLMQQNVPLTPQQVVRLRQLIDSSQRAASIPATIPPKPVSSTLLINLAPGATPPAIRIAQGYISSLVFVDSTGMPWPLASYDIGDPKSSTIYWDGKSNILRIQAVNPYSEGNLVIQLVGLPTPLSLELVSGQRVVDYRTDIHVPGIGPNSTGLPTGSGLPGSANQLLLGVLDGVAPPGSKVLKVTGGDCQAWLLDDEMFLRTRLTVLSPGWVGKMTSPDGMYAYEIQKSASVLVSQYGNPVELKIEGF